MGAITITIAVAIAIHRLLPPPSSTYCSLFSPAPPLTPDQAPELTELAPWLLSLLLESVSLTRKPEAAVAVLEAVLNGGTSLKGTNGSNGPPDAILQQLRQLVLRDENIIISLLMGCGTSGMVVGGGQKGIAVAKSRAFELMRRGMLPKLPW